MEPILNKIIIRKSVDKKTKSGLILPNAESIKPSIGIVIATGKGTPKHPINLEDGDHILYKQNTEVPLEDGTSMVLYENVVAVL